MPLDKKLNKVNGGNLPDMKPLSSKRMIRMEKKKKKMAAYLEISKLNEYDRARTAVSSPVLKPSSVLERSPAETEPSPKRLRTDGEHDNKSNEVVPVDTNLKPEHTNANLQNTLTNQEATGPSGKPKLYGDDYLKLKKQLREKAKKHKDLPSFRLREYGELASLHKDLENRTPLFVSDIQNLIMYSQLGAHSPYAPARWCQLDKYNKLIHTNVFIVEKVGAYHFCSNESLFPFISKTFEHRLELINPEAYKACVAHDLSMVPVTGTQMKKIVHQFGSLHSAVTRSDIVFNMVKNLFPVEEGRANGEINPATIGTPPTDKFSRTLLLLSGWQLVEENFPLPIKGLMERKYPGYVLTKDKYKEVTPFSPMFGIDCEMCKTTIGDLELTRVSVVDENLDVFYETLVKPDNRIVDYLTQYSGITAKMMAPVKKRLQDVQEDLRRLLPDDAILVGQSLSNDMHALKMMHPYVIDTSVIYNITGDRTRKTKLQTLTRYFLNERIQESSGGHCPTEDSLASLKLAQHKLANSLCYGDVVMSGVKDHFNVFPELGDPNYATSMLKHTTRQDKTAQIIGSLPVISRYEYYVSKASKNYDKDKIKFIQSSTNRDTVDKLCKNITNATLNIAQISYKQEQTDNIEPTCKEIDDFAKQIYESTCLPGLNIIVFSGQGSGNGCCFIQLNRQSL